MERVEIVDDIREIHLFKGDSKVSPKEVFEVVYSNLDKLIEFSQQLYNKGPIVSGDFRLKIKEERLKKIYEDSKPLVINSAEEYCARIIFDNGSESKCGISPRTNYNASTVKRPNLLFINTGGSQIALREARTYSDDFNARKRLRKKFGGKFKGIFPSKVGDNGILFIPEPYLTLSLEDLASRGIIGRITPRIKIVDVDEENLWYIRDFLPSLRDMPFDVEDLGRHIGTFHGLGLIDVVDGNLTHYCLNRGMIVNIDPDFITYTKSDHLIQNIDWPDFQQIIPRLFVTKEQFNIVKSTRKKTMEKVKERLGKSSLLDYIPKNLQKHSSIPRLCLDSYQG